MPIKLATNLELPDNAVTQTFGFIAQKGSGKTYAASKLAEGLLEINAPVIIIDPVGNWFGLRLSANGKGPGFPIPVFGGEHGDIEILESHGRTLGKLVVDKNISAVIDVSGFTNAEMKRFVADFAESIYFEARRSRSPRMVILEEAQLFAPQRSQGQERMLGAIEKIVRLGRNFGLGSTMISQRPQSINKEVLNQVECLFVGQLNASHERKAIEAWVAGHDSLRKNWTNELPNLPEHTMMVWSPRWLKLLERVKIAKKKTFDASATPELGAQALRAKSLAEVDVEGLRAALEPKPPGRKAAEVHDAKFDDFERRLNNAHSMYQALRSTTAEALTSVASQLGDVVRSLQQLERTILAYPVMVPQGRGHEDGGGIVPKTFFLNERQEEHIPRAQLNKELRARRQAAKASAGDEVPRLRAGAVRMLQVLAGFHPGTMTKAQIGRAAKMAHTGGTFTAYWGELRRHSLIEDAGGDLFVATSAGIEYLGSKHEPVPKDFEGRVAFWTRRMRKGENEMLAAIIQGGSRGLLRDELANAVGMTESGGTFSAYLGTLTRNKLVLKDGSYLCVHPWLRGKE